MMDKAKKEEEDEEEEDESSSSAPSSTSSYSPPSYSSSSEEEEEVEEGAEEEDPSIHYQLPKELTDNRWMETLIMIKRITETEISEFSRETLNKMIACYHPENIRLPP